MCSVYTVSVPIDLGRRPPRPISRHFSATQVVYILQIFPALLRPAVIARLVLGAHQRIRPTATVGGKVDIAVSPLDRLLNMRAFCFDGFESPCLALRIGKEAAQFRAMMTLTGKRAGPPPVARWLQRFSNPGTQVRKTGITQPLDRRLSGNPRANQVPHGRDQNGIQCYKSGATSACNLPHPRPIARQSGREPPEDQ